MKIPFNINNTVLVKLTKRGKECLRKNHDELFGEHADRIVMREIEEDANGYSKWVLWDLMNHFGKYIYNGCESPIETEIIILTEDSANNLHITI